MLTTVAGMLVSELAVVTLFASKLLISDDVVVGVLCIAEPGVVATEAVVVEL